MLWLPLKVIKFEVKQTPLISSFYDWCPLITLAFTFTSVMRQLMIVELNDGAIKENSFLLVWKSWRQSWHFISCDYTSDIYYSSRTHKDFKTINYPFKLLWQLLACSWCDCRHNKITLLSQTDCRLKWLNYCINDDNLVLTGEDKIGQKSN